MRHHLIQLTLLLCFSIISSCSGIYKTEPSDGLYIFSPHFSPDGQTIFFSARYQKRPSKLGSFDLRSKELRMFFDLPTYRSWDQPAMSPDGTKIAVSTYCNPKWDSGCDDHQAGRQIAIIDRATHEIRILTSGTFNYENPSFSFSGDSIFASRRTQRRAWRKSIAKLGRTDPFPENHELSSAMHTKVVEIDINSRQEKVLFPSDIESTYATSTGKLRPTSPTKAVVSLERLGRDSRLLDYEKQMTIKKGKVFPPTLGYEYTIDGNLSPLSINDEYEPGDLTASIGGEVLLFMDESQLDPKTNGWINWELFVVKNGNVTELTRLKSYLHNPHIALNGEKAVVLSDPQRGRDFDIWVVDINTGEAYATGIRQKINNQIQQELNPPKNATSRHVQVSALG